MIQVNSFKFFKFTQSSFQFMQNVFLFLIDYVGFSPNYDNFLVHLFLFPIYLVPYFFNICIPFNLVRFVLPFFFPTPFPL